MNLNYYYDQRQLKLHLFNRMNKIKQETKKFEEANSKDKESFHDQAFVKSKYSNVKSFNYVKNRNDSSKPIVIIKKKDSFSMQTEGLITQHSKIHRYIKREKSEINNTSVLDEGICDKNKTSLLKKILNTYNLKNNATSNFSNLINNNSQKQDQKEIFRNLNLTNPQAFSRFTKSHTSKMNSFSYNNTINQKKKKNIKLLSQEPKSQIYKVSTLNIQSRKLTDKLLKDKKANRNCIEGLQRNYAETSLGKQIIRDCQNLILETIHPLQKSIVLEKYKNSSEISKEIKHCKSKTNYKSMKIPQMECQNTLCQKLCKYKQFLFMINLGSNIYRSLDIQKYETPLKVYIGLGNNNNLIKSIMKKRFWFQCCKDKQDANFVWTQLKEESIYQKQSKYSTFIKYSSKQSLYQIEKNRSDRLLSGVDSQNFEPLLTRLLTPTQLISYSNLMKLIIKKKNKLFGQRPKYCSTLSRFVKGQQISIQTIHNHFTNNGLLGNKKALFYMLKQFCRLTQKEIFDYIPETFHIKKGFLDEQYKEFTSSFMTHKNSKQKNIWIVKPGQFSNRGRGITCCSKLEEIRSKISKCSKNGTLIIQKYMTNPLLYFNRKFDIRTYMLVTSNNGKIRAYWYRDGYLRTSGYVWKLNDMDPYIHLTNDAIQKNSENYGKYQPGNKISFQEFQRYLDTLPRKNNNRLNLMGDVYPKLKKIATDVVTSSFMFLDPERKGNNFQLFGFDFMIDSNFKPWLIEVNTNPCLELSCPLLQRIIPNLIENVCRVAVDSVFPPPTSLSFEYRYMIPENALHYNKFQIIFDEERDSKQFPQLYEESKVIQNIDQFEEDKQLYEEEGEQKDFEI